jgi:MFS family permease
MLESGLFLSSVGSSLTTIAYPLLTLALTHSPTKAGVVAFARLIPLSAFSVLAGLAADLWPRKRLMIAADAVRLATIGAFAAALLAGYAAFWSILTVGLVEGTASTLFLAAGSGALRSVVPTEQLPAAAGAREARRSVAGLGGPPLGGALYGLSRAIPFVADAVSYLFSTLALLGMRTPFEEKRQRGPGSLREDFVEGFRYMWAHAFLRTTAFLYGAGNFLTTGLLLLVVLIGKRQGLTPGEIGLLSAAVGVGTLAGSLASPLFRKLLDVRAILLLELWTWPAAWAFVIWPRAWVLAAWTMLFGIAAPITDSVVFAYRLATTPDRLVGRVESVRTTISLLASPLGPLLAGWLLETTSARATVAVFAAGGVALTVWGTLSPAIRRAPSLGELKVAE